MIRLACLVILAILFSLTPAHAAAGFDCPSSPDYQRSHRLGDYLVRILPGPKDSPYRCRGTITPPQGPRLTVAREWAMSVDQISGSDINGDGISEVVFDGFSGGAKCCYIYWVVSLEKKPQVVREIRNQVPLVFRKRPDGGIEIRTGEGSFDLFFLPHGDAVIPELVLRLDGDQFVTTSVPNIGRNTTGRSRRRAANCQPPTWRNSASPATSRRCSFRPVADGETRAGG